MNILLKFVIAFAATGLIVSASFGAIAGNRLTDVILTALICTLLSAGLGAGVYQVLLRYVPEVFELGLGGFSFRSSNTEQQEHFEELSPEEMGSSSDESYADAGSSPSGSGSSFGDHILVDKVKIKNEPKLIAAAIRTMLAKDG